VTFAVVAFNHARFVQEAVAGALSQTYRPLQVLLSDDASTDDTWALMREATIAADPGVAVTLLRNERNVGLAGHINRVMEMAEGELVVIAAGDDVSLPHRTQRLVDLWLRSDKRAFSLHSAVIGVSEQGQEIAVWHNVFQEKLNDLNFWASTACSVTGSSHAWDRRVFDRFGPLDEEVVLEDHTIAFRSALLGRIEYCQEPLVRRRVHPASLVNALPSAADSPESMRGRHRAYFARLETSARQQLSDLRRSPRFDPGIEAGLKRKYLEARFRHRVVDAPLTLGLRTGLDAIRHGVSPLVVGRRVLQFTMPALYWRGLRLVRRCDATPSGRTAST
jgi:glycosyltransferase involved in cell wall biosynthesis